LAEQAIERLAASGVERETVEPGEVFSRKQVPGGSLDESLVEDGVDAVLEPCAVAGKAGAFGGLQAKVARVIVWDPDRWQVIEPEQMGQDLGVDLVGFDLCLCDGAGLQRVANSDGVAEGTEDSDHSPRVKSGLHRDLVKGREVALREVCDALSRGGEAMAEGDLAGIVEDDSFDIFLVQIETSEWHKIKSPVMTSQRAAASLKVSCDHRTGSGQNGNYLFELEAQPGGPMGRPDTTAGSKPINPAGRPRSVRPRSPGWDVEVLEHLVPNPVGCSLAQFVAGLQDDHARYDGFGNRLSQTVTQGTGPASVTLVNGNTNRISSAGYAYDSNGNMTQMPKGSGSMTLDYDLSNRVSGVSHPDGAEQYRYAPDNRRVWRSAGRTACYAHRGNDGQFEWVGYGEGTQEQVILYSPGGQKMGAYCVIFSPNLQYFAVTASEENVYYGGRLVGKRLVSVTGSNNGLVSAFTADRLQSKGNGSNYYPYGESKNSTAGDDREGFATYTRDEKSGLDYADQRWYASGVGRFNSPDPYQASAALSSPGSWNRFTYVNSDAINYNDPLGLVSCPADTPTSVHICSNGELLGYVQILGNASIGNTQLSFHYVGAQDIYESGFCTTSSGLSCYEHDLKIRYFSSFRAESCTVSQWVVSFGGDCGNSAAAATPLFRFFRGIGLAWWASASIVGEIAALSVAARLPNAIWNQGLNRFRFLVNGSFRYPDLVDQTKRIVYEVKYVDRFNITQQIIDTAQGAATAEGGAYSYVLYLYQGAYNALTTSQWKTLSDLGIQVISFTP
jgi:RHS repeat-associated protein